MTIETRRPNVDNYVGSAVTEVPGTVAWEVVDDGGNVTDFSGAVDSSYLRALDGNQGFTSSRVILGFASPSLVASNERIKQVRVRGRVRMNSAVPGYGATITATIRDPKSGLGRGGQVYAEADPPRDAWFTSNASTFQNRTGAWRTTPPPNDGDEWTKAILDRCEIECVWYHTGTASEVNLLLSELYVDIDRRTRPTVSAVTASGQDVTTRPTVGWTYNPNADGDRQVAYQVRVFSAAQYGAAGFSADTSPATWDSGERAGSSTNLDVEADLLNGVTYKVYARAAQDFNGSRWYSTWVASSAFTISLTPPPAPVLSVTSDATVPNLRNLLQFTATLNALAADDADFEGGTGNFNAAVNISGLASSTAQARHGVASLAITCSGGPTPFAVNDLNSRAGAVACRPGQQFTLGGYVRANTTGRAWRIIARYHYFDGATESYVDQDDGSTVTDSNSAWTALPSLTVTVPAGVNLLYVQLESTATPAAGEVHYFDQLQVVPGASLPAWAPGFLNTSAAIIERAIAGGRTRNLATRQLYGGGDDTRDASGFHATGASSAATFDMLDRVRGLGSIRWDVEDAGSKLYFGWPSGALEDPAPAYALPAVPGRQYTFSVYLRATPGMTSQLNLQAINSTGNTVGSSTNGGAITLGAGWTRYSATITAPAGAVYIRPHLDNSGSVTGRKVWADGAQWELGPSATDLTRPSGLPLAWEPVRGFSIGKTAVPAGTQSLVAFDHEVPVGYHVIYRAWVYALDPTSGQALSSPVTAYAPTLIDAPGAGQWVLSEVAPYPFVRGQVNVLQGISESQHEEVATLYPIRPTAVGQVGQRPVHLSDYLGGHDMTLQLAVTTDDDWWLVEQLLAQQDALWLTESRGGGRYLRVKDRNWQRLTFAERCVTLADGTRLITGEWVRVATLACDEAERPPDNEAAVLYGVESVTSTGGGGEEPPPEGLLYPGAPANWITTSTTGATRLALGIFPDQTTGQLAADLDHLVAAGARTVWLVLDVSWAFPTSTTINAGVAAKYDAIVAGAATRGLQVAVQAQGMPTWITTASGHTANVWHGPDTAGERTNWVNCVLAFLGRYSTGQIHSVTCWNEPNLVEFWVQGYDPHLYMSLLRDFWTAVKAAHPTILVDGHAMARNHIGWVQQVRAWWDIDHGSADRIAKNGGCDRINIHPYSGDATQGRDPSDNSQPDITTDLGILDPNYLGYRRVRQDVLTNEGVAKPLVFGEFGYATIANPAGDDWYLVTEAQRQAYLAAAYNLAKADGYVEYLSVYYHRPSEAATDYWTSFNIHPSGGATGSEASVTAAAGQAVCCNSSSVVTSGGVTHDYGGNAGCNQAGTAPIIPAGPYSQWGIAGTHRRIEWKLRIDDDETGEGHFWALQTAFQDSPESWYAGLQRGSNLVTNPPGKLALFSAWSAISSVAGTASGAVAAPFEEFGAGYSVYAPYTWTLGATYTLRVQADVARGADWWRFDVIADATGALSYIGSIQVPSSWGDVDGAYAVAFSEWFTNEGGLTSCLQVPRVTAFFGTPGYSQTLGSTSGGSGGGAAVAQALLVGLHRPT
jgi:hypothetical protein